MDDGKFAGHGEDSALGSGVGELGGCGAAEGDKGGGVDDGAAAGLAHLFDGVFAAPPDSLYVDLHRQVPIEVERDVCIKR